MRKSICLNLVQVLVILLCALSVESCEHGHKPFPPPEPTYIQLENSGELLLDAEAGKAEFFYTILGPIPTASLQVVPDSETDWIKHIDVSVEGRVAFEYTANETGRMRIATLNMSYSKARASMIIKQQKRQEPQDPQDPQDPPATEMK